MGTSFFPTMKRGLGLHISSYEPTRNATGFIRLSIYAEDGSLRVLVREPRRTGLELSDKEHTQNQGRS